MVNLNQRANINETKNNQSIQGIQGIQDNSKISLCFDPLHQILLRRSEELIKMINNKSISFSKENIQLSKKSKIIKRRKKRKDCPHLKKGDCHYFHPPQNSIKMHSRHQINNDKKVGKKQIQNQDKKRR